MCRVLIRISVLAFVLAASPLAISDSAAAGPSEMPLLTSPAFASPVTIHWTPGLGGALDAGAGRERARRRPRPWPGHGDGDGQGKGHGGAGDGSSGGATRLVQFVTRAPGACDALAGSARVIASLGRDDRRFQRRCRRRHVLLWIRGHRWLGARGQPRPHGRRRDRSGYHRRQGLACRARGRDPVKRRCCGRQGALRRRPARRADPWRRRQPLRSRRRP